MSERITVYGNKVNLINHMTDKIILEDMKGYVLTYNKKTKEIFETLDLIKKSDIKSQI